MKSIPIETGLGQIGDSKPASRYVAWAWIITAWVILLLIGMSTLINYSTIPASDGLGQPALASRFTARDER